MEGAARCEVLAEACTLHEACVLFSLQPGEADQQQSADTTGARRCGHQLCADEPEDPQEDDVDDDPSTEDELERVEKASSSDISAPRSSEPVRHIVHCLALRLVYGTLAERDLGNVACKLRDVSVASVRDSRKGTRSEKNNSIFSNQCS